MNCRFVSNHQGTRCGDRVIFSWDQPPPPPALQRSVGSGASAMLFPCGSYTVHQIQCSRVMPGAFVELTAPNLPLCKAQGVSEGGGEGKRTEESVGKHQREAG